MDAITASRAVERTRRISEALCDMEDVVREATDAALDRLAAEGAFRVHRGWEMSTERKLVQDAAAKAAARAIMACGWVDLPREVQLIHGATVIS